MESDLELRPATPADLDGIAAVHLAARRHAGKQFPGSPRTDAQVRTWVGSWDASADTEVWVACSGAEVLGYVRATATWLDDLYVVPSRQGAGVGAALLDVVKARRPDGFGLWVFESNEAARAFYARRGLVELERTDGADNEELAPDIKMVWPGLDPLAFFRRLIDEVDADLGDALARRTALTRAVQQHKRDSLDTADPGRDAAREADIVDRVLERVPELDRDRVAHIMHVIITESIEASG